MSTTPRTATASAPTAGGWRTTARAVVIDAAPPLVIFYVLHALGVADVVAYLAGAVVPLSRLLVDRMRGRPFNVISGLIAVFLVVSVILAAITHDVRAVMARGGVVYLAIALVFAGSLATRHPLMLLISRYFTVRTRPDAAAAFDARYHARPRALRAMRLVTAAWAVSFGLSAVACVICAYTLPITLAATVTSLLEPVVAITLATASVRYLRRVATTALVGTTAPAPTPDDTRSSSSSRLAVLIRARPLVWYFGLTYTVSWLCWIPTLVGGGPLIDPHTHAPVLATLPGIVLGPTGVGFLVTAVVSGRAGVRDLVRRITDWRVKARWYAVAILLIPIGEMTVTAALGQSSIWAALAPRALALYLPAYAAHVYFGPLFEETGWRGVALPRLQQRHGPLRASLVLGVLWAGWHFFLYVPSYFRGGIGIGLTNLALFVVSTVAMTFLFTWLANHTRASILLAMLLHGSFDGTGTYYAVLAERHLVAADSAGTAGGLASVVLCVILAVALVVLTKKRLGYDDQTHDEPRSA